MYSNIKSFGNLSYCNGPIEILSFGPECHNYLHIGSFTSIAKNCKVFLNEGNHKYQNCTTSPFGIDFNTFDRINPHSKGDVYIGNDVHIGYGVTIMSGVNIGNGVVIAANSHIISDIPAYSIYGGNPAKLIKYRFNQELIERFEKIKWWDYPKDTLKKIMPLLQLEPSHNILDSIENPDNLEVNELVSRYMDIRFLYHELLHRPFSKYEMEKYFFANISLEEIKNNIILTDEYKNVQQKLQSTVHSYT